MPHDKNGKELGVGDKVSVEMTVDEIYIGAETCEVKLLRELAGEQSLILLCQARQLEKVDVAAPSEAAAAATEG